MKKYIGLQKLREGLGEKWGIIEYKYWNKVSWSDYRKK